MNKVIIMGRIGSDIEVNDRSGTKVANFSVATSEKKNGEEKTQWHRVTVFNKTAEYLAKYSGKGKRVVIEGKIEYGEYTKKDGSVVKTTDIIAFNANVVDFKDSVAQPAIKSEQPTFTADDVPF